MDKGSLLQRQSLSLDAKVNMTKTRIKQFHDAMGGDIYVSFSGGKDSTVLLDLVRSVYPDTPAVFSDTGLEYPEVRDFVKTIDNVVWLKPKKTFAQVIEEYGYPVVSKKVARQVQTLRSKSTKNGNVKHLYDTGYNRAGQYSVRWKIPEKWRKLVEAPFNTSDQCCHHLKMQPLDDYARQTGLSPVMGVMASEGGLRGAREHCIDIKNRTCAPMLFWLEEDVWEYITHRGLQYSKIYDMGEKRTGCMFCMFGVHLEKGENRFQRMSRTHPKLHAHCMDKLGIRQVLEYIGVKTE